MSSVLYVWAEEASMFIVQGRLEESLEGNTPVVQASATVCSNTFHCEVMKEVAQN